LECFLPNLIVAVCTAIYHKPPNAMAVFVQLALDPISEIRLDVEPV